MQGFPSDETRRGGTAKSIEGSAIIQIFLEMVDSSYRPRYVDKRCFAKSPSENPLAAGRLPRFSDVFGLALRHLGQGLLCPFSVRGMHFFETKVGFHVTPSIHCQIRVCYVLGRCDFGYSNG
jgi:hypothetical protein